MGNYKITRKEAADTLDISVRSVDRYIKAGKLRSKKKGKIVYVHADDIDNLGGTSQEKKHIIITEVPKKKASSDKEGAHFSQKIVKKSDYDKLTKTFEKVYSDLRGQIDKKDEMIQKLSLQVGRGEEQMKHSISISEHNKSQILLEESRGHITKQMSSLSDEKKDLESKLKDEKFDKKVLMIFVFILLAIAAYFWFKTIGE